MSARTLDEWRSLAEGGDPSAIRFWNMVAARDERQTLRRPEARCQSEMDQRFIDAYQALADFLGREVCATGSSIRGYWRTVEEEDAIVAKYGIEPKYSDFDVDGDFTAEDIERANAALNPICRYQKARWDHCVPFHPTVGSSPADDMPL